MARIALVHDVAGIAKIQAKLLREAGHEVDEITLPQTGASWGWPAKAAAIPIRLAAYLPAINRLRKTQYDVVHIHWLSHGIVGVLAACPFFAQAHGSDLHLNLSNPVYRWVTRSVLNKAKTVFYVTPNLREYMKGYDAKLRYLPNPVDVDAIAPEFQAPTQVKKVLVFTRLDPVKGIDHIFPAAERLTTAVELTALNWGPLAREYVRSYGRWVRFVSPVPHSEVGAFLQMFDVVIGQMKQGILSLMEIEALAAGRPLITAVDPILYADDPPPVIGASGPAEIADAVEELKANPHELERLASEGREWVCRNHSYANHLQLLESAYFGTSK